MNECKPLLAGLLAGGDGASQEEDGSGGAGGGSGGGGVDGGGGGGGGGGERRSPTQQNGNFSGGDGLVDESGGYAEVAAHVSFDYDGDDGMSKESGVAVGQAAAAGPGAEAAVAGVAGAGLAGAELAGAGWAGAGLAGARDDLKSMNRHSATGKAGKEVGPWTGTLRQDWSAVSEALAAAKGKGPEQAQPQTPSLPASSARTTARNSEAGAYTRPLFCST